MMSARRLVARATSVRAMSTQQHNLFYPALSPTMSKLGSVDWSKDIGSPVAKGGECATSFPPRSQGACSCRALVHHSES